MFTTFSRAVLTLALSFHLCSPFYPSGIQPLNTAHGFPSQTSDPEENYKQCKEMARKGLDRSVANCIKGVFKELKARGRQERAIEVLAEMVEYYLGIGKYSEANIYVQELRKIDGLPVSVRLNALISMGRIYQGFQALPLAVRYYEHALARSKQAREFRFRSRALLGMASVFVETTETERAESYLNQSGALSVEDPFIQASTPWLRGKIYRARGNLKLAREALESARKKFDAIPNARINQILVMSDLIDLYLDQKEVDLAYVVATEVRSKAEGFSADDVVLRASLAIEHALRAKGEDEEASRVLTFAMTRVEKLLVRLPDSLKADILEQGQAPYRELVDRLMQANQEKEALRIVERARARAALSLFAQRLAADVRRQETEATEQVGRRIAHINRELSNSSIDAASRLALEKQLREAELEYDELVVQLQLGYPKIYAPPADPCDAVKRLFKPDEIFISFFLTRERSYAWLITADKVKWVTLPGRDHIENQVVEYLKVVSKRPNSSSVRVDLELLRKRSSELYSLLLGGLLDEIRPEQTLVIEPDGLLLYLPFETLLKNDRYLVEEHNISYVPSVSVLSLLNERAKSKAEPYKFDLLAFGPPRSEQPKTAQNNGSRLPRQTAKSSPGKASLGDFLPGAQNEIEAISSNFRQSRSRIHLGRDATEERFKREDLTAFRYIQLATHAIINSNVPRRSHVVLAAGADSVEDGFLQPNEILDLKLRCDLIVLSACSTAKGQLKRGEGVVGFTSAFLGAGASAAVASLWDVSDNSAKEFMKIFYKDLVARSGPADALRRAKREFIKSNSTLRHPFHWAPFIVVGNAH